MLVLFISIKINFRCKNIPGVIELLTIFGFSCGGVNEKKLNDSVPKVKKKAKVLYPVSQAQAVSLRSQGVAHENQSDGEGSHGDDQQSSDDDLSSYGEYVDGQCSYGDGQTGHSGDQSSHSDGQSSQTAGQTSHCASQRTSHGDGQRSHGDGQMSQADSKKSKAEGQISQVTSQQVLANKNVSPTIPAESAAHETSMNKNTYDCDYCDKMFKLKQSLNRHIVEYHVGKSEMLSCDSCKLFFRRKEHLISHQRLKSCLKNSSTIHECKLCKKVFGSADKLKTHIYKNCLKKYFCNICCKFFKKQKDFSSHNH